MANRPTKEQVKKILSDELQKQASKGYEQLCSLASEHQPLTYEIEHKLGTYQVKIAVEKTGQNEVTLLGSIDGPGVRHFLGWVFSVTDFLAVAK